MICTSYMSARPILDVIETTFLPVTSAILDQTNPFVSASREKREFSLDPPTGKPPWQRMNKLRLSESSVSVAPS